MGGHSPEENVWAQALCTVHCAVQCAVCSVQCALGGHCAKCGRHLSPEIPCALFNEQLAQCTLHIAKHKQRQQHMLEHTPIPKCVLLSSEYYAKSRQSKQCKSRGSPRPLRDWIGPWTPKRIPEPPRRPPWPLRISPGHFRGPECVQNTLCREVWRPSVSRNTLY